MSVAQVRRVFGDPHARLEGNAPEVPLETCAYLQSPAIPKSLGFMFANGRVVRIDVFEAGIKTASGAEVGDSEEAIKQLYAGRVTVKPHKYEPQGHYLEYSPKDAADRGYGMVFETDGARVTSFRSGTLAAIALVGCS